VYPQIKQNYCIFTPTKESVCCWCIGSAHRKQCFDRGWGELLLATKKDRQSNITITIHESMYQMPRLSIMVSSSRHFIGIAL
jgi:hypothetical protein